MLKRFNGVPGLRWLYTRYRQYVTGGVFLKFQECPIDEVELYKKGANAMQVGGRNYKKLPIEPWDYIAANGLGLQLQCWRGRFHRSPKATRRGSLVVLRCIA